MKANITLNYNLEHQFKPVCEGCGGERKLGKRRKRKPITSANEYFTKVAQLCSTCEGE